MADSYVLISKIDDQTVIKEKLVDNGDGTYSRSNKPINASLTCYASVERTATPTAMTDQANIGHRGVHVVIDVTAITASPSIVFTIQGKDPLSGKYYTLVASAAVTGTGTTVLKVYPGITAAANLSVSDILPAVWRVIATHGDADAITYSVGAMLLG